MNKVQQAVQEEVEEKERSKSKPEHFPTIVLDEADFNSFIFCWGVGRNEHIMCSNTVPSAIYYI